MLNILLTGGAGFIGSHVADASIKAGHRVIIVDNLSSGKRENVNPSAEFHCMSIGDPNVEEIFKNNHIDILNHHAAQIDIRKSVKDPVFDARTNILESVFLLECCVKYNVKKVIYSSTGGAIYGEPEYLPADEKHPVRPLAPYGISKFSYEQYLEYYYDMYNLNYTTLRYANVYGPRQDPYGEAGVVAIFSKNLLEGKDCYIFGDGNQTRDYIHVDDVVRANLLSIEKGSAEIMNIGTGVETSVNELYMKMRAIIGIEKLPVFKPERPGEVHRIYLASGKAEKILGWRAEINLDDGLKNTINFFRDHLAKV